MVGSKMSFLRGSTNFVWCTTSVLGKGATGAVFQGVNKNNGESVAVKTFNQMSHMRPMDVQMREFEVLKKVNHENIVKLLAIEDDQEGRGKVIVMELCTGGSLFNILDDPENTYGLPEKEFLLVLEHLCAGMKHLRDNNLVHRDLKPGNIMKFISEDGKTVYKLTDFGAARELEENQPFMSLYGTEEYLHPDMYERAVLRKSVQRSFTANVDLWSIGVTLYHVATGNLPFRPFGGRKNRETMHVITTQKNSGVISGIQLTENGPIEWSRTLPAHCQLSEGLKTLVTPLLAGLLEENREKMWSFDRFFQEVTHILSKRIIQMFYINNVTRYELFLELDDKFDALQEHIFVQCKVRPENQILFYGNDYLETKVGTQTNIKGYPKIDLDNPISLFSKDNNNVQLPQQLELPKLPTFPNSVSVENDASLAKVACSVGHECKRRIETLTIVDKLIKHGVEEFVETHKKILTKLKLKSESLDEVMSTAIELADAISILRDIKMHSKTDWLELDMLRKDFDEVFERIQQLYHKFVNENSLAQEWISSMKGRQCPCESRSSERAKYFVERLRDSWQHLLRDRATRALTYNDEQFHALEKIKIAGNSKKLRSLLIEDVQTSIAQIAECLADWYKHAQAAYLKTEILQKDIADQENRLMDIRHKLFEIKHSIKIDECIRRENELNTVCKIELKQKLKTLFEQENETKLILKQNNELIKQIIKLHLDNEEENCDSNNVSRL
ncbi:serine/threonine-protein kinase TBK1 [Condylostylus longicornis]|uniref:serine/threonine-protein kinase TBK1 n=1 Tax=Condylostylus longicornis TaxID=2530218 RepID=UPI00244DBA3B|nr:serine/threonine-protein kinase TBK1 [Condylostylus longicornis]